MVLSGCTGFLLIPRGIGARVHKHESLTRSARPSIHTIHSVLHRSEDISEDAVGNDLGLGRGDVSVANGGTDVLVTEGFLDVSKVRAIAKQVRSVGVFEDVNVETAFLDAS